MREYIVTISITRDHREEAFVLTVLAPNPGAAKNEALDFCPPGLSVRARDMEGKVFCITDRGEVVTPRILSWERSDTFSLIQ